jgi:hypothetical protein
MGFVWKICDGVTRDASDFGGRGDFFFPQYESKLIKDMENAVAA